MGFLSLIFGKRDAPPAAEPKKPRKSHKRQLPQKIPSYTVCVTHAVDRTVIHFPQRTDGPGKTLAVLACDNGRPFTVSGGVDIQPLKLGDTEWALTKDEGCGVTDMVRADKFNWKAISSDYTRVVLFYWIDGRRKHFEWRSDPRSRLAVTNVQGAVEESEHGGVLELLGVRKLAVKKHKARNKTILEKARPKKRKRQGAEAKGEGEDGDARQERRDNRSVKKVKLSSTRHHLVVPEIQSQTKLANSTGHESALHSTEAGASMK